MTYRIAQTRRRRLQFRQDRYRARKDPFSDTTAYHVCLNGFTYELLVVVKYSCSELFRYYDTLYTDNYVRILKLNISDIASFTRRVEYLKRARENITATRDQ